MASPMLPKRRPRPPLRSRKPRCSRAGIVTVMPPGIGMAALLKRFAPCFLTFTPAGFSKTNTSLQCATRAGLAIRTHAQRLTGGPMTERSKERTYTDAEIEARLKTELPHWYLENGWIRRKYRTNSWKGTLMVINAVGHLAEAAWHHPDITASYAWVEVRLQNHAAKGITDKDFELAKKIEEVVHWQPGKQGGALEGTPEKDQRFAYVKYDA